MFEVGPELSANFRQEILKPFFSHVRSSESLYVVGAASMGKTRLLDYLSKQSVQKHYLGEESVRTWLVRVDLNRLSTRNEAWAFYELMLSSIALESNFHENDVIRGQLPELNAQVIQSRDLLLSLRFFELAVSRLCQEFGLKLCFMLDEFDETYKSLARETFSQLRAIRDANKNRVLFAIFLRNLPERLRSGRDNESFYELFSRNELGLRPHNKVDTLQIIQQLEFRRNFPLAPAQREYLFEASGGHIGLAHAILNILIEDPQATQKIGTSGWVEWLSRQSACIEECRKLWDGLDQDEKDSLLGFVTGDQVRLSIPATKLLFLKGLLKTTDSGTSFFCPVFGHYVRSLC